MDNALEVIVYVTLVMQVCFYVISVKSKDSIVRQYLVLTTVVEMEFVDLGIALAMQDIWVMTALR